MKVQAVRIPWYKKEHFQQLLGTFEDSDKLHSSCHEWLTGPEPLRKHLEVQGVRIVSAYLNPQECTGWFAPKGYKLNTNGRNELAKMQSIGRPLLVMERTL